MEKIAGSCSKNGLNRGLWTAEEDKLLADYISVHGEGKWSNLAKETGLKRCGKSCRLRWLNYLRPNIKRGNISDDEELLIIRLHKLLGNRWSLIAGRLPGRTDNEIKNYWNSRLSKKAQKLQWTLPKLPNKQAANGTPSGPTKDEIGPGVHMRHDLSPSSWASGENLSSDFLLDFKVEDLCFILHTQDADPAINDVRGGDGAVDINGILNSDQFPAKFEDGNSDSSELISLVSFLDSGVDWPGMA